MIHINSLCVVLLLVFTLGSCSENDVKNRTETEQYNATRQARVNHQQQTNNQVGFCTGNNGVAGVCMTRMACTRGGGTQLGFGGCGTYNICCDVPSTCNSNTPLKTKYISLQSPATIADRCTYTIQPYNVNVCQLRFNFISVNLAPPTTTGTSPGSCDNQLLDINGMVLCGDLSDQHLYVPIDQTTGIMGSEFTLQILTQGVVSANTNKWNIQVTQLECPQTTTPQKNGFLTIPRQSTLQDLRKMFAPRSNDADMLAPPGCDQYYTQQTGSIRSFNYRQNGLGQYPQNLHYTICVKRGAGDSTLDLSAASGNFKMGFDNTMPAGEMAIDSYCHQTIPSPGQSNDYILVPPVNVYSGSALYDAVFFCGTSLDGHKVMTEGPFMIIFNSDDTLSGDESGFNLQYNVY